MKGARMSSFSENVRSHAYGYYAGGVAENARWSVAVLLNSERR